MVRTLRTITLIALLLLVGPAAALDGACQAVTGQHNCVTPAPFQPSAEEMSAASRVYDTGVAGLEFTPWGHRKTTIIVDDLPYSHYWQLEDPDQYVFHPMVFGQYIFTEAPDPAFQQKVAALTERVGVDLPNGGLAFYYPKHYSLSRMSGPDLTYSAMSQVRILSGYMRLDQTIGSEQTKDLVERVKRGHFLRYEKGGVDLGVAQLELPTFRSNPEIVLNGWLNALLHLNDYAIVYKDAEVAEYVRRNLDFFADNHAVWYDSRRHISRYSDTSPHRITVTLSGDTQSLRLVHRARDARLSNYILEPVLDLENKYSAYDFRIIHRSGRRLTLGVTCSGLFDTYLVSDGEFEFRIRDGGYSPHRATPDGSGKLHVVRSSPAGDRHIAEIALEDAELFRGYPTNFKKANGKNFYHIQHIVALHYLAKHSSYEDEELNARLRAIAKDWLANTALFDQGEGLQFEDPQVVLDGINLGKLLTQALRVDDLLK